MSPNPKSIQRSIQIGTRYPLEGCHYWPIPLLKELIIRKDSGGGSWQGLHQWESITNMTNRSPVPQNDDELYQLSKEQLVKIIKTLEEKIVRLEESLNLDSKTSSKPPSADLLRKSEKNYSGKVS